MFKRVHLETQKESLELVGAQKRSLWLTGSKWLTGAHWKKIIVPIAVQNEKFALRGLKELVEAHWG